MTTTRPPPPALASFAALAAALAAAAVAAEPPASAPHATTAPTTGSTTRPAVTPATRAGVVGITKSDDVVLKGEVVAVRGGALLVRTDAGGEPVAVPFAELSRVTLREPPVKPVPAEPMSLDPRTRRNATSLFRQVFGIKPGNPPSAPRPPATTPAAPTTIPADAPWQVRLTNGDKFTARLDAWRDDRLTLVPAAATGGAVVAPPSAVAEAWRGTPQQIREARAVRPENVASDTAYVIAKEEKLVAVQGKAVAVDGDALVFRYDDSDRRIALGKLVGLTFAAANPAAPPPGGLHQTFTTLSGDALTGTWTAADADAFTLAPSAGGDAVVLPRDAVTAVAFKGGRLVHLADLTPGRVEQTPYFDRLMPYRVDAALGGGPITLADGPHARGVAVHARCVLDYPLGGEFERFRATLGFEQPAGRIGRAIVRVLGDGRVLYENTDARGDGPVVPLDLPVGGVRTLTLEVDFGADQDSGDRVAWADARLLRRPQPQGIGSAGGQP